MYRVLKPFLFRLDPELAHSLVFGSLRFLETFLEALPPRVQGPDPLLEQELFGLRFPNPIGLAAGLDKNAHLPHVWNVLGFGFAELGTVTARSQKGNARPRLFRLEKDRALINRLGFNNDGAVVVAERIRQRLKAHVSIPIGINIGKSQVVPVENAINDYRDSFKALAPLVSYVVINVSSPNTPGLRELQSEAQLEPLLSTLQEENERLGIRTGARKPLLVKVAPELTEKQLADIVRVVRRCNLAGIIATNTTVQRSELKSPPALVRETGGLSGAPLRERATEVVRTLYRLTGGEIPIVGVGGVFTAADAYEKIRAGASLVQVYTGLIYEGPGLPRAIADGLRRMLGRDGHENVSQAVGKDA